MLDDREELDFEKEEFLVLDELNIVDAVTSLLYLVASVSDPLDLARATRTRPRVSGSSLDLGLNFGVPLPLGVEMDAVALIGEERVLV